MCDYKRKLVVAFWRIVAWVLDADHPGCLECSRPQPYDNGATDDVL